MKKSLGAILGVVMGAVSLFAPAKKAGAQDFYFYGGADARTKASLCSVSTNDLTSQILTENGVGLTGAIGYTPKRGELDFKLGADLGFNINGDKTDSFDNSFHILAETPIYSLNPSAFARISLGDFFFTEYSANFPNEFSMLTGTKKLYVSEWDSNLNKESGIRSIETIDRLCTFLEHTIKVGIHAPMINRDKINRGYDNNPFIEMYLGVNIPQIISTTAFGEANGLKVYPNFTFGGKLGWEYGLVEKPKKK